MFHSYRTTLAAAALALALPAAALAQTPIGNLHCNDATGVTLMNHQPVTIRGIVTAQNPTGTATRMYVQDGTGGVNVFGGATRYCGNVGDDVTVTGIVQQFNGLVEVDSASMTVTLNSAGNPTPAPLIMSVAQVGQTYNMGTNCEPNEARLVTAINGILRTTAGALPPATYASNGNYHLENYGPDSLTNFTTVFIAANGNGCNASPLVGAAISKTVVCVTGVLSQFQSGAGPYTSGYEIIPRFVADITANCAATPAPIRSWGELRRIYR